MSDEAMLEDGTPVSILQVLTMHPEPPLRCPGIGDEDLLCERLLHVRARDSELVAAHFFGHHVDGCSRSSHRSDDKPGDAGNRAPQGRRALKWQVRLEEPGRTSGPDGRRRPEDRVEGTTTRRSSVDPRRPPAHTSDTRSMANVLAAARADLLPERLALPGQSYCRAADVVVPVELAMADQFAAGDVLIWGQVIRVRATPWGGTMLLLDGAADGLAILLPKELRGWFPLAHDREFLGRYVMTLGSPSGTAGKQYIRIPSQHRVTFDPGVRLRRELPAASSS